MSTFKVEDAPVEAAKNLLIAINKATARYNAGDEVSFEFYLISLKM